MPHICIDQKTACRKFLLNWKNLKQYEIRDIHVYHFFVVDMACGASQPQG